MKFSALNVFRFTFAIVVLVALVSASAVRRDGPRPSPSRVRPGPSARPKTPKKIKCKTGPTQCCQSVVAANSTTATKVLNALQISLNETDFDVGLSCVSENSLKHKDSDCNTSLVCCEDDTHEGVIDLKCTPAETD
ncbi:hypothetical protein SCHPADRAFT_891176 [Schizopora paradoxa]|uniref:Hydrophobin n=1 Tax=Schizopora paradoxa TaxID=27342 RepID=A0A0H2RJ22_9AGAM|nr:hypothetical protein SCHPADRAFT_891176 [Schizopora paradoxa]